MATIPRCSAYNGTVLPNKPDFDATMFPNWLIARGTNTTTGSEQYIWLACTQAFLKYAEGVYVYPADADIIGFGANASTCSWSSGTITRAEGPADYYTFSGTYVWSFQPIYSYSDNGVVAHNAGTCEDWDAEEPTITSLTGAGNAESPTGYWQDDTAAALICTAAVSDGGALSYKWYQNGVYVGSGSSYTPSTATAGQFVYYCIVTNTRTGVSGFSDIDTAQSDSMVIVVTATEEPDTPEVVGKRKPVEIMGYVLRQCGVPMAELVAMMLGGEKKTAASMYLYGVLSDSGNIGLRSGDSVTYYDGAVLPPIPVEVMAKQYVRLVRIDTSLGVSYGAIGCNTAPETQEVPGGIFTETYVANGYFTAVIYSQASSAYDNSEWTLVDGELNSPSYNELEAIKWANYDVLNLDGSVYLLATDPIPVGEIVDTIDGIPIYKDLR